MKSRAVYSWEHPPTTVSCLLLYSILWYYDMLVPGCVRCITLSGAWDQILTHTSWQLSCTS